MKSLYLALTLVFAGAFTDAAAAPILYNINFTGGSPNPTSGSFKYDPTTTINPFSEFTVVWNSFTFDFTPTANSTLPLIIGNCDTIETSTFDLFNALSGNCGGGSRGWSSSHLGLTGFFSFVVGSSPDVMYMGIDATTNVATTGFSGGLFDITPAVPEPSTYALLLSGGALMLVTGRRIRDSQGKGTKKR